MNTQTIVTATVGLGGFVAIVLLARFASPNFAAGVGAVLAIAGMFTKSVRGE